MNGNINHSSDIRASGSPADPDLPSEEQDSPTFLQAAKLAQKIGEIFPDSRRNPKPRKSPQPIPQQKEDLSMLPAEERHRRKCMVCHHPDREEIEQEFINWRDVWYLAKEYKISDHRSIYRHARASGLIVRRRENMRQVLDSIIERRPDKVSASDVIGAIRALSCLTDDNRWAEPPTRVEFSVTRPAAQQPAQSPNGPGRHLSNGESEILIPPLGLETSATR